MQKKFHFDAKCNEVCANNGVAKIVLVPKGEFFPLRNGQDMYVQLPFFMGVCELLLFLVLIESSRLRIEFSRQIAF